MYQNAEAVKNDESKPLPDRQGHGGRSRRSRSEEHRRHADYQGPRGGHRGQRDYYNDYGDEYDRHYSDREGYYRHEPRHRDSGYYDDHYYDDADYNRPLSHGRRGARPLYRAKSLPQRDFQDYSSDYYPLHYDSRPSFHNNRVRRPFSNLGDYGYEQGINTYFGHDPYNER